MIHYRTLGYLSLFCLGALAAWTAVSAASPDLAQAVGLYEQGEFQRAAELLARQTQSDAGRDGDLHFWLGKCYLKAQKWDEAVRGLEAAVRLQPSNSMYRLWLGRAYGQKAAHASFLTAFGWAKKLRKEFELAVEQSPDNLDARFDLMEFYLEAPGLIGGGREKAEAEANEIARRSPRLGFSARARLLEAEKKWDLARHELTEAVARFPGEANAYLDLAEFLLRRGDFPAAHENARRALALQGNSPRALMLQAASQVQLKRELAQAERVLSEIASGRLRDQDPTFAEVHYWLGQAHLARGKRDEARKEFEAALRYDRDYAGAKEALSQVK